MFSKLFIYEIFPPVDCAIRNTKGAAIFTLSAPTNVYSIPQDQTPEEFAPCMTRSVSEEPRLYPQVLRFTSHMTVAQLTSWLNEAGVAMGATTIHVLKFPAPVEDGRFEKLTDIFSASPERYFAVAEKLISAPPTEAIVGFSFQPSVEPQVLRLRSHQPLPTEDTQ